MIAEVGPRIITTSSFLGAWRAANPGAGSDSLTPQAARRFLDLLVERELIAGAAARETWTWTAAESAAYAGTRDRIVLRAALDSSLARCRAAYAARGEPAPDGDALGIAAREQVAKEIRIAYDDSAVARCTRAFAALPRPTGDSSVAAQIRMMGTLPRFDSRDLERALARSTIGDYRVSDLLAAWSRLDPIYRPRVATAEEIRELVENGLFERRLRQIANGANLERDPGVQAALAREREIVAMKHLVERDVVAPIRPDSAAVLRYHREHAADWREPERALLTRLTLPDRSAATRMALALRDPAAAESLVVRGRRGGVNYRSLVSAADDSALYARARAAGIGAVVGPDPLDGSWVVARVEAWLPARDPSFAEVRDRVTEAWMAERTTEGLKALVERERRRTKVRINAPALQRLTES